MVEQVVEQPKKSAKRPAGGGPVSTPQRLREASKCYSGRQGEFPASVVSGTK